MNGRRWIASDAGQIPEVDVNTIPSALLERVDIVTGGASAVYGSDAVTGVVNFILKDRLHLAVGAVVAYYALRDPCDHKECE